MRPLVILALALFLATACTGAEKKAGPTPRPQETNVTGPGRQDLRFLAVVSPAPPGRHCPTPSRQEGAYDVLIAPTDARPGAKVVMGGNTPLFGKSGSYVGPTGKIGFWFNLPFDDWVYAYSPQGSRPGSNNGVPVIHIGEVDVAGQCSYRVTFRVPNVPPGTYEIVPIEHGGGGAAAFRAIEIRVT